MESLELENYYKFNKYQTPLTQELKDSLHREVWLELIEYIDSVQFIKNLIAPEEVRGYAKDQPKEDQFYKDGRIYVNVTKPHILENMDFFRERAIFFEKNGRYTNITPNPNPKSEYAEFWREELRRWKYGLVRPSDGEWIPGYLYFYWNYSPIWQVEKIEGRKQGERKRKFPKPWLGDYLFFHYIDEAQRNGKHGKNLKSRGVGVSFKCASMSPRNMYVYPGAGNVNFHLANEKSYLQGDKGLYGKVLECLDHIAEHTPLPKMRLIDGKKEMVVQLGFTDEYGVRKGLLSSVHAISLKDNPDKARGARGVFCHYEEDGIFDNLEKAWNVNRPGFEDGGVAVGLMLSLGCLTENNYVWTNNGDFKKISELKKEEGIIGFDIENRKYSKEEITYWQPPMNKECVRIELNTGRFIECSTDHPILYSNQKLGIKTELPKINNKRKRKFTKKVEFKEAIDIKIGDQLAIAEEIPIFSDKEMWEPRLIGWLVGDGSYGFDKTPVLSSCDEEINNYLHNVLDKEVITEKTYITKKNKRYEENRIKGICGILRELGIYGQTKANKKLPKNIHSYSKNTITEFIGGFFDADGHVTNKGIYLSSGHKSILLEMIFLLQKIGVHGNINFIKPSVNNPKSKNGHYVLEIKDKDSVLNFQKHIHFKVKEKQEKLKNIHTLFKNNKSRTPEHLKGIKFERVVNIKKIGLQPVYNLTAGTTHTYLGNGIITHNTGGVEGGSFIGSEKLFYSPEAYNVFGIPNVFDKNADGSTLCGHFWGAYLNRNDCYDLENGEPDVIKALIEILQERFVIKYNSQDPNAITQKKAELPITPQEAIMRTEGTVFPVADLKEHLESIMVNRDSFLSEHYVGELIRDASGKVIWKPDDSIYPIRSYDKDNQREGAIEIFEMPKTNAEGLIARGRYIGGCLPPGEKVLTDKGLKNVEDVTLEDKLINEKGEYVTIKNLQRYYVEDNGLYEIKLANTYRTTSFTEEHPLLLSEEKFGYRSSKIAKENNLPYKYRKFNFKYKKAEFANVGDWTKIPNLYKKELIIDKTLWDKHNGRIDRQINNPLNEKDFWWFVGLWLGDGWSLKNGYEVSISLNSKEINYIERLKNIIKHLFNREYSIKEKNNCLEITFSFQQLNKFLSVNFKNNAVNKEIPEWVKFINKDLKKELVSGYLSSDGCVTNNGKYYSTEFVSISLNLLEGFQDILFSLGIISSLSLLRDESVHFIDNRKSITKKTYHLRIAHNETIKLKNYINWEDCHKLSKIINCQIKNEKKVGCFFNEDQSEIYFRIDKINKTNFSGIVYNYECETNTFICTHITTHNCDPIDSDQGTSLFSAFIFDTFTDRIVAEYTGRTRTAEQSYEKLLRMAEFYNAEILYENNLKGLFSYFDKKNKLYFLADVPQVLRDMDYVKQTNLFGNKLKGFTTNKEINKWGRKLQADWMNTPVKGDDTGKLNLHTIRSIAYLEEAIKWNSDGNFDRVSAMSAVMILREDRYKRTESLKETGGVRVKDLSNDAFFNKNYNKNRNAIDGGII